MSTPCSPQPSLQKDAPGAFHGGRGFTLIELLVVVAIIALMMGLASPAFNALRGGNDFTSSVYNIAGMLNEGRAYAVANNTFVLAGIFEASSTVVSSSRSAQVGVGKIVVALIAAKNGMQPYVANATTVTGTMFVPVTAMMTFQNIHMVDLQPTSSVTGNMARPNVVSSYDIPNSACSSNTQFAWPLGSKSTSTQYTFVRVIEFDPQGCARIITNNPTTIPLYIDLGLEPAHGTSVATIASDQSTGQIAAIQINGITGAVHIYRP